MPKVVTNKYKKGDTVLSEYGEGDIVTGKYADPTGNKDWTYDYSDGKWTGYKAGKSFDISKYTSSVDILNKTYNSNATKQEPTAPVQQQPAPGVVDFGLGKYKEQNPNQPIIQQPVQPNLPTNSIGIPQFPTQQPIQQPEQSQVQQPNIPTNSIGIPQFPNTAPVPKTQVIKPKVTKPIAEIKPPGQYNVVGTDTNQFDKPPQQVAPSPVKTNKGDMSSTTPPKTTTSPEVYTQFPPTVGNTAKNMAASVANKDLPGDIKTMLQTKEQNPSFAKMEKNFYVYSKENSTFYVFDKNHHVLDKIQAGRGVQKGDQPNTVDVDLPLTGQNRKNATTPGGNFAVQDIDNSPETIKDYGNPIYSLGVNETTGQWNPALHDVYVAEEAARMKILNDPNIKDKLLSYGCINVPKGFLSKPQNTPSVGDSVFVTKEPGYAMGGKVKPVNNINPSASVIKNRALKNNGMYALGDAVSQGASGGTGGFDAAGMISGVIGQATDLLPTNEVDGQQFKSTGATILGGVAKGAAAGAMFGLPGMIVGGVLSGIGAGFKADKIRTAEAEARTAYNTKLSRQVDSTQQLFAQGDQVGAAQAIEVENNELRLRKSGSKWTMLNDYDGKSHAQGGIKTVAQEGDMIVRKDLAEKAKGFIKSNDQVALNSLLMKQRADKEKAEFKEYRQFVKNGGQIIKKYAGGDNVFQDMYYPNLNQPLLGPYNPDTAVAGEYGTNAPDWAPQPGQLTADLINAGTNKYLNTYALNKPMIQATNNAPSYRVNPDRPYNSPELPVPPIDQVPYQNYPAKTESTPNPNSGAKFDPNNLLAYGSAAYNIGMGLSKAEQVKPNYANYGAAKSKLAERQYNISSILAQNRTNASTQASNLRNSGNIGGGDYRSNLAQIGVGKSMADSAAYGEKNNVENQYKADEANLFTREAENRQGAENMARGETNANRVTKQQFMATGLGQVQQTALNQNFIKQNKQMDSLKVSMLKEIYPQFNGKNYGETWDFLKKHGYADDQIKQFLS